MQLISQMSLPVFLVVCLMATAAILGNMISFIMIGKINLVRPENERISYLWWGIGVRSQFKQLYPGNKLVFLLDACFVLIALCFVFLVRFWVFS